MTSSFFTFVATPEGFEPQEADRQTVMNAIQRVGHPGFVFEVTDPSLHLKHETQPEWQEHIACGGQFICPVSSSRDVDIDPRHKEYWRQLSGSASSAFIGMVSPQGFDFELKPGCYVIVAAGSSLHVGPASLYGLKIEASENEQKQEFQRPTEGANSKKRTGRGKRG